MLTGLNESSSSLAKGEKASYCFNTMSRIETMKKAIVQTEKLVNKTKETVEIELSKMLKNGDLAFELQQLNIRIRMLREQLDRERSELDQLKHKSLLINKQVSSSLNNNTNHGTINRTNMSHSMNNNSNNLSKNLSNNLPNSLPTNLPNSISNNLINNASNDKPIYSSNSNLFNDLSANNSIGNQSNFVKNSSYNLMNNSPKNLSTNSSNNLISSSKDQIELINFDQEAFDRDKRLLNKIENEISIKNTISNQINESLLFLERKLMTELYDIFPIKESQESGRYTILDLQLPDLTDQLDENDVQIKISLGYCCLLLITISKVFDLPLKHAIIFSGSQSWIVNETENPKLKDKKYPLFLNRDKTKFYMAIHLLNENIAQIRHHFNLHTNDHKKLSTNLFSLFYDKLLLKDDE